ncbi:MAG: type III-B CRISPR module RAMP protein Cmr4 [Bacteroidota bacterium]
MIRNSAPLFLTCETPLHAGSGDALGVVDLPIQRERHTSFPKIEASSLKGAFREAIEEKIMTTMSSAEEKAAAKSSLKKLNIVFGFDESPLRNFSKEEIKSLFQDKNGGEPKTDFAGAIGFTDARLLLFPVKSMKGVFAWVTCPQVLRRLETDMKLTDSSFAIKGLPNQIEENKCYNLGDGKALKIKNNHIVLEEYAFEAQDAALKVGETALQNWLANTLFEPDSYWHHKARNSIILLSDSDFKDFVNLSTEVITRTKINNKTGTVQQGALFTEEYLPAESILYTVVLANPQFAEKPEMNAVQVLDFVKDELPKVLQIGGSATLGKGIVRIS